MENLPVILLKGLVLLPNSDIRLEFDDEISKSLIEVASIFHHDNLIVVNQFNNNLKDIDKLPNIGIIGSIKNKLELPNGKSRVTIDGKRRVIINKYYEPSLDLIEASFHYIEDSIYDDIKYQAYIRKIYYELDNCIKIVPKISNSVLSLIANTDNLDYITDVVANNLPISKERLCEYANCIDVFKRSDMILHDIYKEKQIYEVEKDLDNKIKKTLDNHQREYILKEKLKVIKSEIGDFSIKDNDVKNLNNKLLELKIPDDIKCRIKNEINKYKNMNDLSPEISVIRKYIDWLINLPWNIETKDIDDLDLVRNNLNKTHFGLDEVKLRIIEYLAVNKSSSNIESPIICLVGPPGVGKTTLAYSIAKSINRNFIKISVAGVSDECEIMGHMKSYVGASPGKIISGIRKAKSMNPVFLIDEIDKMSKSYNNDPTNCLLELLDSNQNKYFCDHYIDEAFDLSKVIFILTANNIQDIPSVLKDRLEIIEVNGYTEYEKIDIANNYLIPKICKNHAIDNLKITPEALSMIIRNYTKESGVRDLERNISKIVRKIITLINPKNLKDKEIIDKDNVDKYLGKSKYNYSLVFPSQVGVVNGLSCTSYGGDILPIEVNYYKGIGKLILTGSLGNVIKESAMIALSYIKANYKKFNIRYDDLINNDIHIHIPSGSILKEGPSAGVALTTSLISAFSNLKIHSNIAMTGEITLRGNILPVGGLREKSIGAVMNNIKKMFIPYDNLRDLDDIPKEVKEKIEYIPVKNYMDIYSLL